MQHQSRRPVVVTLTATLFAVGVAISAAGCGGGSEASPTGASGTAASGSAASGSTEFTVQSADFQLPMRSDIGTHDAYVTFTSRSDGKTDAIVDFYVPRTPQTRGDVYPVSIHEGDCSAPGSTTISLGDLSPGITTVLLEEAFDEAVLPVKGGSSSVVIMEADNKTIAWCGPSSR